MFGKKFIHLGLTFVMVSFVLLISACGGDNSSGAASSNAPANESASSQPAESSAPASESAAPSASSAPAAPIKIGVIASKTGLMEGYAAQTLRGFEIGIDYATKGTKTVGGRPIEVIIEDDQLQPNIAIQKATKLFEEDKVDFLVGTTSSAPALALLPLAEEYKKIMVVDPAVADSITGENWNKYIFRTARNSSQDAVTAAAAFAAPGVKFATLAQDYAYGRDAIKAFKPAAEKLGAQIIHEEYADPAGTDFTANIQKILKAKPDVLYFTWAGANSPFKQLVDMKLPEQGIKLAVGAPDIAGLKAMKGFTGESFTVYYHGLPNNDVNKALVDEYKKRFNDVPDLFSPGGMSAAIAIVEALNKTNGDTDTDKLIGVMEGMSFETPKGTMTFRKEDHQALQTMYKIKLEEQAGVDYPVPVLIKELTSDETAPPIMNKR